MPYRGHAFAQGQYYHVFNRGAGKQKIFFTEHNYRYLLQLAGCHAGKYGVTVIAYCLMPNHYHFLLRQETPEPFSKFIKVLFSAYVQALNMQQGRTGTLFEGRFRYKHVADLAYVLQLSRYIHLNPVKAGLVYGPEDWQHSDYAEWIGLRDVTLGDSAFIQSSFPVGSEYRAFVADAADQSKHYEKLRQYVWD